MYKKIKYNCSFIIIGLFLYFANACSRDLNKTADKINKSDIITFFKNPPLKTHPQVWWWWLQTPSDKASITLDLEEMKAKGLSGCMILDGGVGPFGPAKWKKKTVIDKTEIRYENTDEYKGSGLSQPKEKIVLWSKPWRKMVRFASLEAGRLGLDLGVFIGPAGCAAPWVTPKYGQQEVVFGNTIIEGGRYVKDILPIPKTPVETRRQGENKITKDAQNSNYNDIAVLALPYNKEVVSQNEVVDITDKMTPSGKLEWTAPKGKWKIIRFGYRPTGRNLDGNFYIDHLSKEIFDMHWKNTAGLLLKEMSPRERRGFKYIESDSWEAGNPNWTKYFPREFKKRRGYDIVKFLPVLAGETIGNKEQSQCFRNDFKLTISDLISEDHYGRQREVAHKNGLESYAEAAGPHQFEADLLKCVSRCDVAMGEFWMPSPHREKVSGRFLVREAASAAHIYGIKRVFAESFTSVGPEWEVSPFQMKAAADQAFCDGLNWICFHTFSHHPSVSDVPGITHSAGTHFDRTNTWWNQSPAFINYLSRCSYMLQQGKFVADVLFYKGHDIRSNGDANDWKDGYKNPPASLGTGYDYDKCNEEVLLSRLIFKNGKLTLPDGLSYNALILDKNTLVSIKALKKIVELARQGATIIGEAPQPFLGNSDDVLQYHNLVNTIWGKNKGEYKIGKGRFVWNTTIRKVLFQSDIIPDFECSGVSDKGVIDFIHRKTDDTDIYFVCSRWQPVEKVECSFRVTGKQPELWNPVTGETRKLSVFKQENGRTIIPLEFDPCGSFFIVFRGAPDTVKADGQNWSVYKTVHQINGPWNISFDPKWGGPSHTVFDNLTDWSLNSNKGIKYYSGKVTYFKTFDMPSFELDKNAEYFIDLGEVHELADVRLNGKELGVIWTKPFIVNITSALKEKDNRLEIDVVNLWPNRLTGDAFLPEKERFTNTNIRKFTKNSMLLPSGLLGPVRIKSVIK